MSDKDFLDAYYQVTSNTQGEEYGENSPFWVYKRMTEKGQYVCDKLTGAGPLGWGEKSINSAHIKFEDIQELIDAGIVETKTLLERAVALVQDPEAIEKKARLDREGGYLAIQGPADKKFYVSFAKAQDIIDNKEAPNAQEIMYQVRPGLYNYIALKIDF